MARSVNKVILIGHLGGDPETRVMPSGMTVANIRVADVRLITQSENTSLASYNLANQLATFEDRVRMRNL